MWRGSCSMLKTKHRAAGWRARAWKSDRSSQPSLVIISCYKSKGLCFLSIPHKTDDTPRTVVQEYTWRCIQRKWTSPGHWECSENTGCYLHLMSRLESHLGATNWAGSVGMQVEERWWGSPRTFWSSFPHGALGKGTWWKVVFLMHFMYWRDTKDSFSWKDGCMDKKGRKEN